ncbi:esterase/lipase family protein [Gluconacetobacter entanii]|uniref:esterase/lipase family protein n=1 Tax=Gluconacetobacter entanii TaxID=108528 RepID=UPI0021BBF579|nr:alpha/beta hydrolase [Gluconacetobacter entanii]MCW4580825.1 alpha/beta hydrolase [Gluconacetobacter entanii]MCW4584154.1 alpha/beta hydrolase [Gluconacetobacter entanii]MCW4587498.1 alpha/beta hydrolase [Gluconacetobacter entanii]
MTHPSSGRFRRVRPRRGPARITVALTLTMLAACAGPVEVRKVSLVRSYDDARHTTLQGHGPGPDTRIVLHRRGLDNLWNRHPDRAIAALRQQAATDHDDELPDMLFALAELSYRQGLRHHRGEDFLAAAVYAYAFLQPGRADGPNPYDPRFRQAADFYNLGLTAAFPAPVAIVAQRRALPFGEIELSADPAQLHWHGRLLEGFLPTATLAVSGMRNVYRTPGLGEALTALGRPEDGTPGATQETTQNNRMFEVTSRLRIPANMTLDIDDPRRQVLTRHLHGRLVMHVMDEAPDTPVPPAYDQTAARAISLQETALWTKEYRGFFDGTTYDGTQPRLVAMTPHRPGNMPVVFIHGTASSPYRWAGMVNDLLENRNIRDHFDFWFFSYATSNPIPYSAWQLRRAITQAVDSLGGTKADPALGHITLVGHSQGGLLARMLVINPGDRLWNGTAGRPLSTFHLNARTRELIQETMFPTPMPEIQRVVFIATPQHGSYLAGMSLAQLIGGMASLPWRVSETAREIVTGAGDSTHVDNRMPRLGSVYAMSPRSPFMRTLPTIPIMPDVHTHSIIPVCGTGDPLSRADDGVVSYESAHIPGVDSELVVRHSEHSTQSNPFTIAEVQRILLLQLAQNPATASRSIPQRAAAR